MSKDFFSQMTHRVLEETNIYANVCHRDRGYPNSGRKRERWLPEGLRVTRATSRRMREQGGAGWTTLRTPKGFGLYPMVMGSSRRFQAGHIYFLRRSLWNMGGEDKIGGWEMSLEAIAIARVKNEGLSRAVPVRTERNG